MYHRIVKRRVRALFDRINAGDWKAMTESLAPGFSYRFVGDTPLGGIRNTRASMELWWQRLFRLLPAAQFYPQAIVSEGWPWNTTVVTHVRVSGVVPAASGKETEPYENEFMQMLTLKWGRITRILTIEDTLRLAGLMPRLAASGIADATAAPIEDAGQATP
jgi:ketosteroid isomerase-like protein